MKITATIITLNEENNIRDVIQSVQDIYYEVLVIDSFSSDKTCEIAISLGAKVVKQTYLGDGQQKAFGAPLAKNNWILSIDADERLDVNAIEAIKNLDLENTNYDAFSFARKTYIGKEFIKLWYPDRVTRLYNRLRCSYSVAGGHAKVDTSNVEDLDADMLHYSYEDYAHMIKTSHKFITRGAKISYENGEKVSSFDPFIHGVGALFKALVLKGGAIQGVNAWNVAVVSGFSSYMKYALILEMQNNEH